MKIAYFGGEPLGAPVLKELVQAGLKPDLVVCNPDRASGRGQQLTPPPVKLVATENDIEVWQPEKIDDDFKTKLTKSDWDLFVVVAYNHILPKWLLELPKHQTINFHPSLLPKLRGPSPIRTALLEDKPEEVGVSIMLLDEKMDHGPILTSRPYIFKDGQWPMRGGELDERLAKLGAGQLLTVISEWTDGKIEPEEQDHEQATYTNKLSKEMGELEIDPHKLPSGEEARHTLLKIRALDGWPSSYFFYNGKRVKIVDAEITNDTLQITRVVPEGKKEMDFDAWLANN